MDPAKEEELQNHYFTNFLSESEQLRSDSLFTDVLLQCDEKVISVHKVFISAFSPYFKTLFSTPSNSKDNLVKVDYMNSDVLEILLKYCYTGTIDISEKPKEFVEDLLKASIKLQVPSLFEHCWKFLLNSSSECNLLSYWREITESNDDTLTLAYFQKVIKHLEILKNEDSFLQLTLDQLKSLLECPAVDSVDQEQLLDCILCWIKHSQQEERSTNECLLKQNNFSDLFDRVDFSRLSESYLHKLFDEPLLENNINFWITFKQILRTQFTSISNKTPNLESIEDQNSHKHKFLKLKNPVSKIENSFHFNKGRNIMILNSDIKGTDVLIYDSLSKTLSKMVAHPLYLITNPIITKFNGYIYSFNGVNRRSENHTELSYRYSISEQEWQSGNYVCLQNSYKFIEFNGSLFVLHFNSNHLKLERFDPGTLFVSGLKGFNCRALEEIHYLQRICLLKPNYVSVTSDTESLYFLTSKVLTRYKPVIREKMSLDLAEKLNSEKAHIVYGEGKLFIVEEDNPKNLLIFNLEEQSFSHDVIPAELNVCKGMVNMENPFSLEIFVVGDKKSFIYRPPFQWEPCTAFEALDIQLVLM